MASALPVIKERRSLFILGIYNLQGQRVGHPTQGIYIKNGRKYIIK